MENKQQDSKPPDQADSDAYAFIVRIWKDGMDERGMTTAWHGSIDHVGSSTRLYFRKLDSIVRFVRERTGIDANGGQPWWQWLLSRFQAVFSNGK